MEPMPNTSRMTPRRVLPLAVAFLILAWPAGTARVQQQPDAWRQLGGPHRNFRVDSAGVATAWGAGGPARLWSRPLGEGYSSILADGELLVTMYREDDEEVVVALDAATGATRWQYAYHTPLLHDGYFDVWLNSAGPGPYSTPLIAGDTVFAVGVDGRFHALDKRTGELRWAHDLVAAFDVGEYNAFASSPIAYGRTVILPLGGSGSGVVALERETGATVWRSPAFDLAPGSPVLIDVDGQEQLAVLGQQELVGLDPRDGRRLWSHPHPNELGLNISMPVWGSDNALFLSSGYGGGSRLLRLSRVDGRTTPEEVWFNNRMRVHFGSALRIGQLVVGSTGDLGPAFGGRTRRRDRQGGVAGAELRPRPAAAGRRQARHRRRGRGDCRGVGHRRGAGRARARGRADGERVDPADAGGQRPVPPRSAEHPRPRPARPDRPARPVAAGRRVPLTR